MFKSRKLIQFLENTVGIRACRIKRRGLILGSDVRKRKTEGEKSGERKEKKDRNALRQAAARLYGPAGCFSLQRGRP